MSMVNSVVVMATGGWAEIVGNGGGSPEHDRSARRRMEADCSEERAGEIRTVERELM
ncbi:hypothetical protein M6B38_305660 [Iris pallida]|uniref:Uncharacterized protein n=1 Tax=Iris pallida TaxID=29817 RepID=A0AAX6HLU7_IRIPA|nr:hypothetical protein M6B38_305660 [Iris pallida]